MKQFRHAEHNHTEEYVAKKIAENWATAEVGARTALKLNHILERHKQLKLIDSVGWAHDYLLSRLKVLSRVGSVAVHPVCSTHHLGLAEKLHALGEALAEKAVTPIYATCCVFAGDRGFLHPELTHVESLRRLQVC